MPFPKGFFQLLVDPATTDAPGVYPSFEVGEIAFKDITPTMYLHVCIDETVEHNPSDRIYITKISNIEYFRDVYDSLEDKIKTALTGDNAKDHQSALERYSKIVTENLKELESEEFPMQIISGYIGYILIMWLLYKAPVSVYTTDTRYLRLGGVTTKAAYNKHKAEEDAAAVAEKAKAKAAAVAAKKAAADKAKASGGATVKNPTKVTTVKASEFYTQPAPSPSKVPTKRARPEGALSPGELTAKIAADKRSKKE
jgi:hypothetical protein